MALFEALKDGEIRKLFLKDIFGNNKEVFDNFDGVVRFIRNTFSHNIRDRIDLKIKDYEAQYKYYLKNKRTSIINFFFDYIKSPIPIKRETYIIEINIDFNKIKDGVVYTDIISEYQTILFIEFCYNCMIYLKNKSG